MNEHESSSPGEWDARWSVVFQMSKTVHSVASESSGLSRVAKLPRNKVGISTGYSCKPL